MFTGIITDIGEIVHVASENGWLRVCVRVGNADTASRVRVGSSVAVSGVCLTVTDIEQDTLWFSILPETISKTVIGSWHPGVQVNLENALCVGDELGGHMVYGHVDGVGTIRAVVREGESVRMSIEPSPTLFAYCVSKGSIAIDGVSLTIASIDTGTFDVALIAYTLAHTTLGEKKSGDLVHIECDMLIKYIASNLHHFRLANPEKF